MSEMVDKENEDDPTTTPPEPEAESVHESKELEELECESGVSANEAMRISSLSRIAKFSISRSIDKTVQPPATGTIRTATIVAPEEVELTENFNYIEDIDGASSTVEPSPFLFVISKGSVVDFQYFPNESKSAIVNAANEGCLGGGGVDGAISFAGGENLHRDRHKLPIVERKYITESQYDEIRCPTGKAAITGPGNYGKLHVPFVLHAVGPNYWDFDDEFDEGMGVLGTEEKMKEADELLRAAYVSTLEKAKSVQLESIAFSLLSAGIFRGRKSLKHVLEIGVEAIRDFEGYDELKEVHMCAFNTTEEKTLLRVADELDLVKI